MDWTGWIEEVSLAETHRRDDYHGDDVDGSGGYFTNVVKVMVVTTIEHGEQ